MGAALSSAASTASAATAASATLSAPLSAQYKFPVVVNRRFCTPRAVLLELQDGFSAVGSTSTAGFAVKEARADRELLRLASASALAASTLAGVANQRGDRWLLDGYGVALARLRPGEHRQARRVGCTIHSFAFDVSVGTRHPQQLTSIRVTLAATDSATTSRFRSRPRLLDSMHHHREPTLAVEYEDPVTGEQSRLGCAGDWAQRRAAVLFLEHGAMAPRQAVAKAFRPDLDGLLGLTASSAFRVGSAYRVEVAPGVDAALVLLICAAIDDAMLQVRGHADDNLTLEVDQEERTSVKARAKGPQGDAVGLLRRIHHRLLPARS